MTTALVVDDSATDRRLAAGILKSRCGCEVLEAADVRTALESIEADLPDLVLTDLVMPGDDGLRLIEVVKEDYPLIPVIIMTARGNEEMAVKALERGASSYVPKRRLAQDLPNVVKDVLAAAKSDRTHLRLMHRAEFHRSVFALEPDPSLLAVLVSYLQKLLRTMRLYDEADRLRVGIAVEAALNNALYRGNLELDPELRERDPRQWEQLVHQRCRELPYRDRKIHVDASVTREQATYVVQDEGQGIALPEEMTPDEPPDFDRAIGRGLFLMRIFMDEVTIGDGGHRLTLIKRHRSSSSPMPASLPR